MYLYPFFKGASPGEEIGAKPLRINSGGCKNVKGGNPKLDFSGIISNPMRNIQLPDISSFGRIEPRTNPNYYEPKNVIGGALYLKEPLTNPSCDAIVKNGDYTNIVGTMPDGKHVFYMNY